VEPGSNEKGQQQQRHWTETERAMRDNDMGSDGDDKKHGNKAKQGPRDADVSWATGKFFSFHFLVTNQNYFK
jgi:hypothetical protein